jgi:hypothetical protein
MHCRPADGLQHHSSHQIVGSVVDRQGSIHDGRALAREMIHSKSAILVCPLKNKGKIKGHLSGEALQAVRLDE